MAFNFRAWLRQPTTIHGIAGLAGMAAGFGVWYATRNPTEAIAAGGSVGSGVALLMNDNSTDKRPIESLVSDAVTAVADKRVAEMLPTLAKDVQAVLVAHATAVPATPPTV